MDDRTERFRKHVLDLEFVALNSNHEPRRLQAIQTLAYFYFLLEGWRPGGGGDDGEGCEIIDLSAWRPEALAA